MLRSGTLKGESIEIGTLDGESIDSGTAVVSRRALPVEYGYANGIIGGDNNLFVFYPSKSAY